MLYHPSVDGYLYMKSKKEKKKRSKKKGCSWAMLIYRTEVWCGNLMLESVFVKSSDRYFKAGKGFPEVISILFMWHKSTVQQ